MQKILCYSSTLEVCVAEHMLAELFRDTTAEVTWHRVFALMSVPFSMRNNRGQEVCSRAIPRCSR